MGYQASSISGRYRRSSHSVDWPFGCRAFTVNTPSSRFVLDNGRQLNNQVGSLHSEVTIRTSDLMNLVKSFESPLIRTRQELSDFTERQRVESTTAQCREERKEILQWLSTIPYKSHHRVISEKILTDTGSWLMNDPRFTGWMNSSVTSVLWLHGSRRFLALRKSYLTHATRLTITSRNRQNFLDGNSYPRAS